ncbi:MAG: InlB B-repeat-containing protein [Paludibacteraceae bacterium]|nr:InlB B-repeat-containing protein [Paludibacteraceae bacterium]
MFLDWNATKLYEEQVEKGKDAKGPDTNPTREGYVFTGWEPDIKNITADRTVIAQYEKSKVYFTVTYLDWNATKLYEEKVEEGHDAKGPETNPTRDGYVFTGWEPDLKNITADHTVIAQYEKQGATGLDDLPGAESGTARKFLRNGVLYIERGGKTYTVQGTVLN